MSAQVTEEHIYTTAKVGKAYVAGEDAQAAQLIADSEAAAILKETGYLKAMVQDGTNAMKERDQLRAELAPLRELVGVDSRAASGLADIAHWKKLMDAWDENVRLRAEVERLRECCDQTSMLCGKFITEDDGTDLIPNSARIANALTRLKARAERAEAEMERLKKYSANLENDVKYLTQGVPEGDPLFLAVARAERAEEIADRYGKRAISLEAELARERQKVRALTAILESICEEWGRNHNTNPIGAGQRMETLASKALEKLEDEA